MSDIFRDVDEALQREKAAKLWKEYGPTLVMAALVLVLSTAAVTAYRSWDAHKNRKETAELLNAVEAKDTAAALEKAAGETTDGHKALALLAAANKMADGKEFKKAAALYDSAAKDSALPSDMRDLANILYTRATLLNQGAALDYKALAERLIPIAKNPKSAFQLQAKLEAATILGTSLKDYAGAVALLDGFDEPSVSASLKEKADALKNVYGAELAITKAEPPTSQQPAAATP